jgi:hypothetical protein
MRLAIEDLPCWSCTRPIAAAIRHRIGQCGELNERSPVSGLPTDCCKILSLPIRQPESIPGASSQQQRR